MGRVTLKQIIAAKDAVREEQRKVFVISQIPLDNVCVTRIRVIGYGGSEPAAMQFECKNFKPRKPCANTDCPMNKKNNAYVFANLEYKRLCKEFLRGLFSNVFTKNK
jgi:hypothetical protein